MGTMSKGHRDQPEHPASYLISANSMQAPPTPLGPGRVERQVMLLGGCRERGKAVTCPLCPPGPAWIEEASLWLRLHRVDPI